MALQDTGTDRHIRHSAEDYATELAELLPFGIAWPRHRHSVLMRTVAGLAKIWAYVDGRASDLLERETDPRFTLDLIGEWERAFGLPDECLSPTTNLQVRRVRLLQRMTLLGGQSRAFYIAVARQLGYEIKIREYAPFVTGISRCGAKLDETDHYRWQVGPPENRFYWTVAPSNTQLRRFRAGAGMCGIDPLLDIFAFDDLECTLDRIKPGHTAIIYDYSGYGSGHLTFDIPAGALYLGTTAATARIKELIIGHGELRVTSTPPRVDREVDTANLYLSGFAPAVKLSDGVVPASRDLRITTDAPLFVTGPYVAFEAGNLLITTSAPTVERTRGAWLLLDDGPGFVLQTDGLSYVVLEESLWAHVIPPAQLTVSTSAPSLAAHVSVIPAAAQLVLAPTAPQVSVTAAVAFQPTTTDLQVTPSTPTAATTADVVQQPSTTDLVATTTAPVVEATVHYALTIPADDLAITGSASIVDVSAIAAVLVPTTELQLSAIAPTYFVSISVAPSIGQLVITRTAPSIELHVGLAPQAAQLVATSSAPTVGRTHSATPSADALTLSTAVPAVGISGNQYTQPSTSNLQLSTILPYFGVSNNQHCHPSSDDLALSASASSVTTQVQRSPSVRDLVLSAIAPTVAVTTHQYTQPASDDLVLSKFAPSLTTQIARAPAACDLVLSKFAPTITTQVNRIPATRDLQITRTPPERSINIATEVPVKQLLLSTTAPTRVRTSSSLLLNDYSYFLLNDNTSLLMFGRPEWWFGSLPGQLTITGYAPELLMREFFPGRVNLRITSRPPNREVSDLLEAVPEGGVLSTSTSAPAIEQTMNEVLMTTGDKILLSDGASHLLTTEN